MFKVTAASVIETLDDVDRSTVEEECKVGRDAAFSTGTQMSRPSALLLHLTMVWPLSSGGVTT